MVTSIRQRARARRPEAGAVLTKLRRGGAPGSGRVDSRRPPAGALPAAAPQDPVGQRARPVSTPRAVVLVSGGLDSTTMLAIARAEDRDCYALSVDYGQRHRVELEAARRVAMSLGAVEHRTMRVDSAGIGGSALTDP